MEDNKFEPTDSSWMYLFTALILVGLNNSSKDDLDKRLSKLEGKVDILEKLTVK